MEKKDNIKPMPGAQKALDKLIHDDKNPKTVEELTFALGRANNTIQNMRMQMNQMNESYRDLQLRLATTEFQHRLEFLWKVLFTEGTSKVFGNGFIEQCADEFKEMMFPPMPETEMKGDNA